MRGGRYQYCLVNLSSYSYNPVALRSLNPTIPAVTNGPGWMKGEEIIARYEMKTGRDLSGIAFYETFARFKIAVVIQQIYFRYVQGQTRDERFCYFDGLVRELAIEALELARHSGI